MATLFLFLASCVALRRRSFHQMDLLGRQKQIRAWMRCKRSMVASDATYQRVLPEMDRGQLREDLQRVVILLRQRGYGKVFLAQGRSLRALAVDGSVLSGRYASVVEILGVVPTVLDFEPCENKGKELPASERLLSRVFQRHGAGCADILLGDGLYMTQGMLWNCRRRWKTHLLVKTTELNTLLILQDAEAIFGAGGEFAHDVEHVKGTDVERGLEYEVWAARGFHHGDFPDELKVARVRIKRLKGPRQGKTEPFWIITTDVSLSAEQMRELAHLRWSIENHTFRAFNEFINSKHIWVRGRHAREAFEALMLILFLAFNVLQAYKACLDAGELWERFRLRKVTLDYVSVCLLMSLPNAAGLFSLADDG